MVFLGMDPTGTCAGSILQSLHPSFATGLGEALLTHQNPQQCLQTKCHQLLRFPHSYITASCTGISDNYGFEHHFSFLSEHSMFSDLHFPALIICSADQFSCLEVQRGM